MGLLSWFNHVLDWGNNQHSHAFTLIDDTGAPAVGHDSGSSGLLGLLNQIKTGVGGASTPLVVTPVASGANFTTDQDAVLPATPGLRLFGFSAAEVGTPAANATFRIMHGTTAAGGTLLEPVSLTAGESTSDSWPDGLDAHNGLSVDMTAGTVQMTLKTKVVT